MPALEEVAYHLPTSGFLGDSRSLRDDLMRGASFARVYSGVSGMGFFRMVIVTKALPSVS